MSLFGSLMGGDFEDDLFMGNHMNAMNMQMRSMNRLMNSLMPDPFNMLTNFDPGFQQNALMERNAPVAPMGGLFGFPAMPNMNRLLSADIGSPNGASYCSSSVISMSSGPDGRPQIYQATSSTKTGPNGIRETRKTVQDSTRGLKKMAIGHHIGDRSHIIEKEQDLRSGQLEERQEFINLDEEEAEDFDREFTNKVRMRSQQPQEILTIEDTDDDERPRHRQALPQPSRRHLPAITAPPQQQNNSYEYYYYEHQPSSLMMRDYKYFDMRHARSTTTTPATTTSTSSDTSSTQRANVNAINAANYNNNNNNNYMSSASRRAYRSHVPGATPRRPLRTPLSSPLATTPTNHSHSTATSPSVHPHPYNTAAARRNYRAKHSKQHQQPHEQQQAGVATTTSQHSAATGGGSIASKATAHKSNE